jgi:hypothetical protein
VGPGIVIPVAMLLCLALGVWVYRIVRPACERRPWLRPLLILGSVGVLVLVGVAAPRLGNLDPPFSESPAGIFVVLGRVVVWAACAVAALATILAAGLPRSESRAS